VTRAVLADSFVCADEFYAVADQFQPSPLVSVFTEINDEYLLSDKGAEIKREIPMGRFGNAGDLDGALLLLVSDAGSYMTGATIVVDGGQVVQIKG